MAHTLDEVEAMTPVQLLSLWRSAPVGSETPEVLEKVLVRITEARAADPHGMVRASKIVGW